MLNPLPLCNSLTAMYKWWKEICHITSQHLSKAWSLYWESVHLLQELKLPKHAFVLWAIPAAASSSTRCKCEKCAPGKHLSFNLCYFRFTEQVNLIHGSVYLWYKFSLEITANSDRENSLAQAHCEALWVPEYWKNMEPQEWKEKRWQT